MDGERTCMDWWGGSIRVPWEVVIILSAVRERRMAIYNRIMKQQEKILHRIFDNVRG